MESVMLQVALSLANLAALLQAQGKGPAAEELVRRALSIREDALGPDHPLVTTFNPHSLRGPTCRTITHVRFLSDRILPYIMLQKPRDCAM